MTMDMERIKKIQDMDFSSEGVKEEILNLLELLCGVIISNSRQFSHHKANCAGFLF